MVEHSGVNKPKAGQWWQYNGVRVFVVGLKLNGHAVCEYRDGALATLVVGDSWKHIPDCTGFDYVPEPKTVYPVWCLPLKGGELSAGYRKQVAYYRYDSKNSGMTVHKDGTSFMWNEGRDFTDYARRVVTWTEAEECVELPNVEQHKATSRTIGADGNDEREASKLSGPKWITMLEVVREGALGREVVWVEHPGGLWQTGQTRSMRVQ